MPFSPKNVETKKRNTRYKIFFLLFSVLTATSIGMFLWSSQTWAATGINDQISFQGKVVNTDGTNVTNGDYDFVFKLYTASSGGVAVWTETWNSGTAQVTVTDGIFQVNLGTHTDLPGSIDFNTDNIYLGIEFNGDGEMSPRVHFTAAPYAFNALKVAGLTVTDTTGTLTIPNGTTISFADAFTTSGAFATTLTATGTTNVTLPTTGTLATLAGSETLTNKTIGSGGLTFQNTEVIGNGTDDIITFTGAGGTDNTDLYLDLDGTSPVLYSSTDARVSVDDFLNVQVSGVSGAAAGDIWYDSAANKFKVNENGTTKILCNTTDAGCGSISADSLDFTEFKDALALDASTDISVTGSNVFSVTNTGTGNSFVINDSSSDSDPFLIDASGNLVVGTTSASADTKFTLWTNPWDATGDYRNFYNIALYNSSTNNTGSIVNAYNQLDISGTGNKNNAISGYNWLVHSSSGTIDSVAIGTSSYFYTAGGNVNEGIGERARVNNAGSAIILTASGVDAIVDNTSTGTITTAYGVKIAITNTGGGTVTTGYGLYINDIAGTTDYGVYQAGSDDVNYFAGNTGFGDTSPASLLTVGSGDLFQVNSSGAIAAAAGITSSGTITFSSISGSTQCLHVDSSGVVTGTGSDCGSGGTADLQTTYGYDADGSNATISLTTADDGLVFTNPTSSGTDSAFLLQLTQQNTTAAVVTLDLTQSSNAANGMNITANSIDTETGLAITTNGLTSGAGMTVNSSSTAFTGSLAGITLSGSNASNTGNVLAISNTGTLNTNTTLFVDHRATGTNNLAVRINDESGDTTPFVIDGTGQVGIGTTAPSRVMDIFQAASAPQLRLSKDITNYSEFTVDSVGDLQMAATGTDIKALSENLWVCDNDACPALTLTGDGNIFIENVLKFGNGVYIKNDSATELSVYDNDDNAMLIFDEL